MFDANSQQEEDFVANLYHRKLLRDFHEIDINDILSNAILYLNEDAEIPTATLRKGLLSRLKLRTFLLAAVQVDGIVDPARSHSWERCLELLPTFPETTKLGLPIAKAFSIKTQRRLASSVPPRPIVNISFDEAFAQLTTLCQNGKDAYRILDYNGGPHLMVCNVFTSLSKGLS